MARPKKQLGALEYHPRVIINHTHPDLLLFAARAVQVMLEERTTKDKYQFEEGVIVECSQAKTKTVSVMAYRPEVQEN